MLDDYVVVGVQINLEFLWYVVGYWEFVVGNITMSFLMEYFYEC